MRAVSCLSSVALLRSSGAGSVARFAAQAAGRRAQRLPCVDRRQRQPRRALRVCGGSSRSAQTDNMASRETLRVAVLNNPGK